MELASAMRRVSRIRHVRRILLKVSAGMRIGRVVQ